MIADFNRSGLSRSDAARPVVVDAKEQPRDRQGKSGREKPAADTFDTSQIALRAYAGKAARG